MVKSQCSSIAAVARSLQSDYFAVESAVAFFGGHVVAAIHSSDVCRLQRHYLHWREQNLVRLPVNSALQRT